VRVRGYLTCMREPHPEVRFGSRRLGAKRAVRPSSLTYYRDLRAFTRFCLAERLLEVNPLWNVSPAVPGTAPLASGADASAAAEAPPVQS
jgi:hypothetical protein